MFEKTLETKLKKIFGVKKVTFSQPGKSNEQEVLFVDVEQSRNRFKDGFFIARVTGTLTINANADKLPFGYFSKQIEKADPADKEGLAFFDFERNNKIYQNIVQRTVSFTYFFKDQFDPAKGLINDITIQIGEV